MTEREITAIVSIKTLEMLDGLVQDGLITSYTAPTPSGTLMQVTREGGHLKRRFLDVNN